MMNVAGMAPGSHFAPTALFVSHTRGKSTPKELPNAGMPPLSSSSDMPTMTRPLVLYLVLRSCRCGNDSLQGPHHVAQKSTTTTFPERPLIEILPLPFAESSANGGAGLPMSG